MTKKRGKTPIKTRSTRQRMDTSESESESVSSSANNPRSTSMVQLEVPSEMLEQILEMIQTMGINRSSAGAGSSTDPIDTTNAQDAENNQVNMSVEQNVERLFEVTDVVDHRVVEGRFQFLLRFRGYREPEWIDDEMCECTEMISDYLKTKKIKTIYIFCRVSTSEQASSDHMSLQAQEAVLRQRMQRFRPYDRVRVYHLSQSAYRDIPHHLQEIGRYANREDVLMVWRVDRLSRNVARFIEWLDDLNRRGVIIYSFFEDFTFRERRLDFLQAIIQAERESENIGHRVRLSVQHRRNRGDHHVGTLRYGRMYQDQLDAQGNLVLRRVVPMPAEVAIIHEINNSNLSASDMAVDLNNRGITRRNRRWTQNMIRYIRSNFQD